MHVTHSMTRAQPPIPLPAIAQSATTLVVRPGLNFSLNEHLSYKRGVAGPKMVTGSNYFKKL